MQNLSNNNTIIYHLTTRVAAATARQIRNCICPKQNLYIQRDLQKATNSTYTHAVGTPIRTHGFPDLRPRSGWPDPKVLSYLSTYTFTFYKDNSTAASIRRSINSPTTAVCCSSPFSHPVLNWPLGVSGNSFLLIEPRSPLSAPHTPNTPSRGPTRRLGIHPAAQSTGISYYFSVTAVA
jgi:hypothetical protein